MKTLTKKLTVLSAIIAGFINSGIVQAGFTDDAGSLNYDNRAYVHAIHNAPNPVSDQKIDFAKIAYADKAYGQAIYSYPSTFAFTEVDFNVEYVDTAYGQAIYSYPNNNAVRHHLDLSASTLPNRDNGVLPVSLKSYGLPDTRLSP
jgi:hypothetical protein